MTTLNEYYDMLERADWTYEMSDDHSVWQRGRAAMGALERIAKESPEHKALFDGFFNHVWSGPHYDGQPKKPKPERPPQ